VAIREGAWDCPSCGRKRNRGAAKFCGGCGTPRGSEVKFYLPGDAREVSAEEAARAQAGPDWTCSYCGGDNPADAGFCSGCGATKDGKPREVVEYRGEAPGAPPETPPAPSPLASPAPKRSGLKKGCGIGCLSLLALISLVWFLGRPRQAELTVAGFHWERAVQVEQRKTVEEGAWEGAVPSGARVLGTAQKLHHVEKIQTGTQTRSRTVSERVQTGTEKVKVGTRDLGNGYFEDVYEDRPVYENRSHEETYQEPVYRDREVFATWVRYQIDKWVPGREEKLARDDQTPEWPAPRLGSGERAGARRELYQVIFRGKDGKTHLFKAPGETEWRRFESGRSYRARVWPNGEVERVEGPT
jgi:Zn-finger in Ran binding protein and others